MAKLFLSYRRSDTGPYADHLRRGLETAFDVFHDRDDIQIGDEFPVRIATALREADIVLVLIGKTWATATDSSGARRLANPVDWVRVEVASALRDKTGRVIPVLFDGAPPPAATELCEELRPLCRINAYEVNGNFVDRDVSWLRDTLVRKFAVEAAVSRVPVSRQIRTISAGLSTLAAAAAVAPSWIPELPANFWTFPAAMAFAAFVWWIGMQKEEGTRQAVGRVLG